MAGAGNVGYATMQIIPSAEGFAAKLTKSVTPAVTSSGEESGKSFSEKFSGGVVGKLGGLLKGAGVAAGVALVGGLVTAAGQQDVAAGMQASLGLNAETSAKFGAAAGLAYKQNYGDSVESVGDTIKAAFQNGIVSANDSKDAIAGVVGQIETYSKISGTDAVESTRAVAQMIKTGIAKDATQAFDLLTRGQQLGINKSEDLLDTFNEYGTQFRKLGIDGPQALGLMNQAIQNGARDSDLAADALKEFSIRAVDGSKSSAAGFEALGLNAKTMTETFAKGGPAANKALQLVFDRLKAVKDPAKQSAAAVNLFGTQAEDLGKALYSMDPSSAVKGIGDVAGATDKANKALSSTPTAKIQTFTRSLKQGFVEVLGGSVLPAIEKAAGDFGSKFGPAISGAAQKLKQALPPLLSLATTIVGAVVPGIATAVSALGNFGKFLTEHTGTAKAFGIAIGIIAAGLVTAKIAFTAISIATKTWAAVQTAASVATKAAGVATTIWSGVTKAAAAAQWLLNVALSANPIGLVVLAIAALIAIIVVIATKTDWFQKLWKAAWGAITTAASATWNWIKANWPKILDILSTPITKARDLITTAWDILKKGASAVLSGVTTAFNAVVNFFKGLPGKISSALGAAVTFLVQKGKDFITGLYNGVKNAAVSFLVWWGNLEISIAKKIGNAASALVQKGKDFLTGLKNGAVNAATNLYSFFSAVPKTIVSVLGNVGATLYHAGTSLISGFINGIKSKIGDVKNTLGDLTSKLTSWKGPPAKDAVLLAPAGRLIIGGFISGLESRYAAVKSSLVGFTNGLSDLPIRSASGSGHIDRVKRAYANAGGVNITVNGQHDPEATARIVGRKLAGAGV